MEVIKPSWATRNILKGRAENGSHGQRHPLTGGYDNFSHFSSLTRDASVKSAGLLPKLGRVKAVGGCRNTTWRRGAEGTAGRRK